MQEADYFLNMSAQHIWADINRWRLTHAFKLHQPKIRQLKWQVAAFLGITLAMQMCLTMHSLLVQNHAISGKVDTFCYYQVQPLPFM